MHSLQQKSLLKSYLIALKNLLKNLKKIFMGSSMVAQAHVGRATYLHGLKLPCHNPICLDPGSAL